jgi:hypothetical protein
VPALGTVLSGSSSRTFFIAQFDTATRYVSLMGRNVLVISTVEHADCRRADVGLAIRDALATFPADEIVVAVRPEEEEGFVESSATDTAPQHRIEGVPVRLVAIGG